MAIGGKISAPDSDMRDFVRLTIQRKLLGGWVNVESRAGVLDDVSPHDNAIQLVQAGYLMIEKFFAPKPDRRIDVNTLTNVTIGKGIKHSNE